MKFTLAVVLIVLASRGAGATRGQPSSQPPASQAAPQPSGAEATPEQAPTHATSSERCASGKDRSRAAEPAQQEPASAAATKVPCPQPRKAAVKVTGSRKTKARRHPVANDATVKKTIVRNGGTSDPTALLTPATTESSYSRQMTTDLLAATDANLKQASARSLNSNQVETVNQIKLFMVQANAAIKAGELDRGHNLAVKAHLLSDDLVKH